MKTDSRQHNRFLSVATCLAALSGVLIGSGWVTADDQHNRSTNRSVLVPIKNDSTQKTDGVNEATLLPSNCSTDACLIPNASQATDHAQTATHSQTEFTFTDSIDSPEFSSRDLEAVPQITYPTPLGYGLQVYGVPAKNSASKLSRPDYNNWNPNAGRDEYVFDGSDRGKRVQVDQSWNVHGLETEDTIGHFDTLDGRRIVTPSNRVAIYAPRFGAVRKVDGVFNARLTQPVVAFEEKTPLAQAAGHDNSSTTKQHLALNRFAGANRASGFVDRTRGVVSDTVTHLFGASNTFKPFENLSLLRIGKWSNAESARLDLGIQSALVWEDDLGLQVVAKKVSPIIVRDVSAVQAMVKVDSEDGTAILRVTKVASKIAARTGEFVDFTIRYDNLSGQRIGNVTIIDNLTRRLEYVPDSAQSSHKSEFISEQNDGGSLMLRWEITEPVAANSGGIIRFRCRVR